MAALVSMKRIALVGATAVALAASLVAGADPGEAAKPKLKRFTKSNAVAQSGDLNFQTELVTIDPIDDPFSFPKLKGTVRELSRVEITLTIEDGDTGPGEFAEGDLTLALDGIDTGLVLDGFRDGETDTRTIGGAPANAEQLVAALKADGELAATIIDADAGGNNEISLPANFETTLVLKGRQQ